MRLTRPSRKSTLGSHGSTEMRKVGVERFQNKFWWRWERSSASDAFDDGFLMAIGITGVSEPIPKLTSLTPHKSIVHHFSLTCRVFGCVSEHRKRSKSIIVFFFVLLVFTTRYNWWDPPRIDESRFVSWQHLWRAHLVDWRAAIICNCMSGLLISINLVIEYFALQRLEYDGSFTYLEVKKYAATLFFWRGDRHLGMTQITRKDEFGLFGYLHYCYVCSDGSVTAAF